MAHGKTEADGSKLLMRLVLDDPLLIFDIESDSSFFLEYRP